MCFGFNRRVSIIDVNIGRILIRFYGLDQPKRIRDSKELWEKVVQLLPKEKFSEYNLYLFDFGSLFAKNAIPDVIFALYQKIVFTSGEIYYEYSSEIILSIKTSKSF